ncbi:hypothetical protein [Metallibacterium scheffleri]|uniref:hypothetical protein n=1 Tax=Metallibacterium scheffleri TaxID=993689 RepID=UPI00109F7E78|nr:hypothetical protein [Metallibacterium scheffleri]
MRELNWKEKLLVVGGTASGGGPLPTETLPPTVVTAPYYPTGGGGGGGFSGPPSMPTTPTTSGPTSPPNSLVALGLDAHDLGEKLYNAIKYGDLTPNEIAEDIYTDPNADIPDLTWGESVSMASDIYAGELSFAWQSGSAFGSLIYDNLPINVQQDIGNFEGSAFTTIDSWLQDIDNDYNNSIEAPTPPPYKTQPLPSLPDHAENP